MSERSDQTKLHPWTLPQHPHTARKQKQQRRGNNIILIRNVLFLIAGSVFLPIIYIHQILEVKHVAIPSSVHKSLKQFQAGAPIGNESPKTANQVVSKNINNHNHGNLVLTAYLEPPETLNDKIVPLPIRQTTASKLKKITFPKVANCSTMMQDFPIDDYPLEDPFLPWIHDIIPSKDSTMIQFVAQNRRRCDTGDDEVQTMKFWEPQISLMQRVPLVVVQGESDTTTSYRLASSFEEATHNDTRFQCRFHHGDNFVTTLSEFPFDYEFVTWRKKKAALFQRKGKESDLFWTSQVLFNCPVPQEFQHVLQSQAGSDQPTMYVDLVPIRTPARQQYLLTPEQTGPSLSSSKTFDLGKAFGTNHVLPRMNDAGRWQNLPICPREDVSAPLHHDVESKRKQYRFVACTWAASSYTRRGDAVRVSDSAHRLREWITFHLMVGVDHIYIYDNTDTSTGGESELRAVAESFGSEQLTYHVWPCKICNNNRPAHKNPGERSSQYAAEASCRTRYGELTEWMTFIDTDEYMVPMKTDDRGDYKWSPILDEMDEKGMSVMKFRSSRGKPRIELTEVLEDQSVCVDPVNVKGPNKDKTEPCLGAMRNKTFLQVYNCEFIRPPKPERFARAMKQIYRPSFVLSHFVHYSTVTTAMAMPYVELKRQSNGKEPVMDIHGSTWEREQPEMFMNELSEGALVHARSVLPHDTRRRSAECYLESPYTCMVGFLCEDEVEFFDDLHQKNVFHNSDGSFCNCWRNKVVDNVLVPKLELLLAQQLHWT